MSLPSKKFYAVSRGRKVGIFKSWPTTSRYVNHFSGARYQKFKTYGEAKKVLHKEGINESNYDIPTPSTSNESFHSSNSATRLEQETSSHHALMLPSTSSLNQPIDNCNIAQSYSDTMVKTVYKEAKQNGKITMSDEEVILSFPIENTDSQTLHLTHSNNKDTPKELKSISTQITPNDLEIPTLVNKPSLFCNGTTQTEHVYTESITQTDISQNEIDDIISKLSQQDETIKELSLELNLVKLQLKNEIKANSNASGLDEIKEIVSEIKSNHLKVMSSISDNKSLSKDIVKICNKTEENHFKMKNELEALKLNVYDLSEEMNKLKSKIADHSSLPSTTSPPIPEYAEPISSPCYDTKSDTTETNQDQYKIKNDTRDEILNDDKDITHVDTPADKLCSISLDEMEYAKADKFIIGDSQIKHISPNKLFKTRKDYAKKICIPGINALDLLKWLKCQNIQRGVNTVILHVGINGCFHGNSIKESLWSELIQEAQIVFPGANILMSSIPPVGTHDKMYQIIKKSNENLENACKRYNVMLADNTNLFLTRKGAPKQDRLENKFHPNLQGSIDLAMNLRYHSQVFEKAESYTFDKTEKDTTIPKEDNKTQAKKTYTSVTKSRIPTDPNEINDPQGNRIIIDEQTNPNNNNKHHQRNFDSAYVSDSRDKITINNEQQMKEYSVFIKDTFRQLKKIFSFD